MTLGRRERITLFVGIPLLFLGLLYKLFLAPSLDELHRLNNVVARKQDELRKVERLVEEQAKLETDIREMKKGMEARGGTFNLFGFINSTASELKMKDRCGVDLKPQRAKPELDYKPSVVGVTLQGVSLKELTDFLYRIHAADKLLTVDPIEVSVPGSGQGGLIVTMTVSTLVSA